MAIVKKAPEKLDIIGRMPSIFLAGSIEMGAAENWQARLERELGDVEKLVIMNPRRDDWDSSWVQSIDNDQFREQVEWELYGLENATVVPMYFAPECKAPITLLELGLHARFPVGGEGRNKLIVCCPEPFWRKGNVDIVCSRYNVQQVPTLDDLVAETRRRLGV